MPLQSEAPCPFCGGNSWYSYVIEGNGQLESCEDVEPEMIIDTKVENLFWILEYALFIDECAKCSATVSL